MLFLLFASAVLVAVNAQAKDPTKVCLPDKFQAELYSIDNDFSALVAFDFIKKVMAVRYPNKDRNVFNLADLSVSAVIDETGDCRKVPLEDRYKSIAFQCLPANAVEVTTKTLFLGLNPGGLEIEAWQFESSNKWNVTLALTKTSPAIPVLRKFKSIVDSDTDIDVLINPKTMIDDKTIFDVPSVCPEVTVVG